MDESCKPLQSSLLRKLTSEKVVNYARSTGWQQIEDPKAQLAILHKGDEELLVPLIASLRDYHDQLGRVLSFLASVEGKTPNQMLDLLLLPPADVFKFRIADETTETGTAPLPDALHLLNGARKALAASARTVIKPAEHFARLYSSKAVEFLNTCRLGQTEYGSFIAHIICPVEPLPFEMWDTGRTLFGTKETFGRKVNATFARAIYSIGNSIERNEVDKLVSDPIAAGLSTNLCEALLEMQPDGARSSLSIAAQWDAFFPAPTDLVTPVTLRKDYFPVIEQIGRDIKPKKAPESDLFFGRVDELKGAESDEGMAGEVILILFKEEELLKCRVDLAPNDYATACDAHRDSKYVVVNGELHRHGRIQTIKQYQYFRIWNPPNPDQDLAFDDD